MKLAIILLALMVAGCAERPIPRDRVTELERESRRANAERQWNLIAEAAETTTLAEKQAAILDALEFAAEILAEAGGGEYSGYSTKPATPKPSEPKPDTPEIQGVLDRATAAIKEQGAK